MELIARAIGDAPPQNTGENLLRESGMVIAQA